MEIENSLTPPAPVQDLSFAEFPNSPGVYMMKDAQGRMIYVGKAKNLRKRVGSYFRSAEQLEPKTRQLMAKVRRLDYLCTASEKEALLLENSLIKKHRPRYNIVLRDDKSYILFKLEKKTAFPRLSLTRRVKQDGSSYYGPFTSAASARETLRVVNRIFPLRKCKPIQFANRTRPCLQHQMGRCLAPCVKPVSAEGYGELVEKLELFLAGASRELLERLQQEMEEASRRLHFERAAEIRDQLKAIQTTVEQQSVVLPQARSFDLFGPVETEQGSALGLLFIRQGKVLDAQSFFWDQHPSYDELIRGALLQFYTQDKLIPERIVLSKGLADTSVQDILSERRGGRVKITAVRGRAERQLLKMAQNNALQKMKEPLQSQIAQNLHRVLGLSEPPHRIEVIDVSHLSGQGTMVGQVVFEQGWPIQEDFRIYRFPELEGSFDDYAALSGWAARRIASGPPWPDLVLIDGGKGQLAAVQKALAECSLHQKTGSEEQTEAPAEGGDPVRWSLAAIAKDKDGQGLQSDRIYRPYRKNPLPLKTGRPELLFLQNLRDRAHGFVLSRQKQSRRQTVRQGRLEALPGVGPKTAVLLRRRFDSQESLLQASLEELTAISGIGLKKAQQIVQGLQKKKVRSEE